MGVANVQLEGFGSGVQCPSCGIILIKYSFSFLKREISSKNSALNNDRLKQIIIIRQCNLNQTLSSQNNLCNFVPLIDAAKLKTSYIVVNIKYYHLSQLT